MWVSSHSSKSCELARLIVYLATAVSTSLPMSSKGQALITASSLPLGMAAAPALPLDCKFMSKKMWSWGQDQLWAWPRAWHSCCQHITSAQSTGKDSATEHKDVEWFIAGEVKLLQVYTYMALVWIQEIKIIVENYYSEQRFSRQSFSVLSHRFIKAQAQRKVWRMSKVMAATARAWQQKSQRCHRLLRQGSTPHLSPDHSGQSGTAMSSCATTESLLPWNAFIQMSEILLTEAG